MPRRLDLSRGLQQALEDGDTHAVQNYLDGGVNPNLRGENKMDQGKPLISFASMNGRTQVVQLLIKRGAEVDKADFHGRTPLSWAAEYGQIETVQLLISYGAKVNSEDKEWDTPLGWVIHVGTGDKIDQVQEYLISKGAKVNLDHTPLRWIEYQTQAYWNMLGFKLKGMFKNLG